LPARGDSLDVLSQCAPGKMRSAPIKTQNALSEMQNVPKETRTSVSSSSSSYVRRDSRGWPALLDSLRPVASAAWNATATDDAASASNTTASMCTPGTRVSLLQDVLAWAIASTSPCVFWLNGLAGTGKSTIARTLCERLHEQGLLGASFFISRGQADRRDASNIVRTIAHQLAFSRRPVSEALCAELRETPLSVTRSLQQQISDFIIAPSRALLEGTCFIIIIDALDESSPDSRGRPGGELLLLLVRQLLQLDGRVRLFITSRNEIPIPANSKMIERPGQITLRRERLREVIGPGRDRSSLLPHGTRSTASQIRNRDAPGGRREIP
jgi:hypothetical protein